MLRVIGETIEEMKSVARRWPEATTINWPPRSNDSYKSKSIPALYVDVDRRDILEELRSAEVDENYLRVLTWLLRERLYDARVGHTEATERFFQLEIRGNLIRLLKEGSWVDQPENLGLKNLNRRLEKLDLGRRSDLNFSSEQSAIGKFDQDFKKIPGEVISRKEDPVESTEPDFTLQYRDGSVDTRNEILESRPWMRSILVERYGEP